MRDENADRVCGGIIHPPSRSSFYIVRSRSPLTVNNRRFRAVTSGTRDSRSIPARLRPRRHAPASVEPHRPARLSLMSQKSHAIEGNSRRTMHAECEELQEYPVSYEMETRAFSGEAFRAVHASACRDALDESRGANRTVEEFLDLISGFVHRTQAWSNSYLTLSYNIRKLYIVEIKFKVQISEVVSLSGWLFSKVRISRLRGRG